MLDAAYNLFVKVVSLSAMASVLVLIILALRFLFKDRLKPAWTYLLWIPLVVRLVIPWSPESAFSIYNFLPLAKEPAQTVIISSAQPVTGFIPASGSAGKPLDSDPASDTTGAGFSSNAATTDSMVQADSAIQAGRHSAGQPSEPMGSGWTPLHLLVLVWLGGVMVVLSLTVTVQLRFTLRVRREPEVRSLDIRSLFEDCQRELQVRRPVKLIETKQMDVPALLGVMRPKLLLPTSTLQTLELSGLRHVFLHELAHVKRRDIPLNLLTSLLLALHWFNPLLWYAVGQMKADQEVACDALALTHIEPECHRGYALTLLNLLETTPAPVRLAGAAGISSSKKEMERRIIMITRHKNITAKNTLLGLAVIMVLSGCTLTGAKLNSAPVPEKSAPVASPTAAPTALPATPPTASLAVSPIASPVTSPDKAPSVPGNNGILLAENNGITVTAKPIAGKPLLNEITVAVRSGASRMFLWDVVKDTSRPPRIDEEDVNGDGTKEIIIRIGTGTGTGLSMNDIHVLEAVTMEELPVEDPVDALNQRLNSSITQRNNLTYLSADLDGKHMSGIYDIVNAWERIGFGAIVYYELQDGHIVARMAGSASMSEFPLQVIAVYGKDLTIDSVQMYYNAFTSLPLNETDAKYLMENWLTPASGWTFGKDGGQYTMNFTGVSDDGGNGRSYTINPLTGTVYDTTSGSPLKSFVNREAIELGSITNGSKYLEELYKLLQPILDVEGFEPARKEWISGFFGDGYVFGEVKKEGREFTIKAEVFTGQWEEIADPFK